MGCRFSEKNFEAFLVLFIIFVKIELRTPNILARVSGVRIAISRNKSRKSDLRAPIFLQQFIPPRAHFLKVFVKDPILGTVQPNNEL